MKPLSARVASACLAVGLGACSSSSSSSTHPPANDAGHDVSQHDATSDATATDGSVGGEDVRPDVIIDPKNCVMPGASSSEKGIGGYCSPAGGQCVHAGVGGTPTLCTGDFGAPAHEWFCTISCSATSDCGLGGGTCLLTPFAQICVPAACASDIGDATLPVFDAGDAGDAAPEHDGGGATDAHHDDGGARDGAEPLDGMTRG